MDNKLENFQYCDSLTQYKRRETIEVKVGDIAMGGINPIRIQSMTTVDTMDTQAVIEQSIRMINAGCEYVRITAPSIKEAENLALIKKGLKSRGYDTPIIADIHFTPNAAEVAARIVEKVRINPGNYVDKKKFEALDYTDDSYESELDRIREKFTPLVNICKEYGAAMRIGTNHGSLSDRILSRYGDTPLGMVESALEFLRICDALNYHNIVLSMKASNTQVMVQAYRLLVNRLDSENMKPYPLHLGVTEAGEAEDGRIKSAVGIGTLLEDGLGDTVRVSLTEEPEFEIPVAQVLVSRYVSREDHDPIKVSADAAKDPFSYAKRKSSEVDNIGGKNVPRVIADCTAIADLSKNDLKEIGHYYLPETDKWGMNDLGADYIYTGQNNVSFMLPNGLKQIVDYDSWVLLENKNNVYPLVKSADYHLVKENIEALHFVQFNDQDILEQHLLENAVVLVNTNNINTMPTLRSFTMRMEEAGWSYPVIYSLKYSQVNMTNFQLFSATDLGGLLIDGLGDGAMLSLKGENGAIKQANDTAFGILQAARTRMSKTEYISCPSCGRTLFDLQQTTAMIRKQTDHLKGIKIGIMGCIVNGPGEMADADYGYVGVGKGKITLYRGQEVVKKGIDAEGAVDELINLIKEDGNWVVKDDVAELV